MTIEASNILSMLSNSPLAGGLTGVGDAASPASLDFAAALFQQLGALQAQLTGGDITATGNLAASSDLSNLQQETFSEQNLQNFAALFGNRLPTGQAVDKGINLDDTLATLSDVMQSLQQLQAPVTDTEAQATTLLQPNKTEPEKTASDALLTSADPTNPAFGMQQPIPVAITPMPTPSELSLPSELISDQESGAILNSQSLLVNGKTAESDKNALTNASFRSHTETTNDGLDSPSQLPIQEKTGTGEHTADSNFNKSDSNAFKAWDAELSAGRESSNTSQTNTDKNFAGLNQTLQQLNQAVSQTSTPAAPTQAQPAMQHYFGDSQWNQELGDKLIWMHKQDMPSAELRLNPEHLGPVLVKINMQNDQTNVTFTTQHLAVKEAIEAAIPKLREMLNGQQLNLADVNVSQQQGEQHQPKQFFQMASDQNRQRAEQTPEDNDTANSGETSNEMLDEIETGRAVSSNGLLSLFA